MGNCESLSETATNAVSMKTGTVVDGSEEAAFLYSNQLVLGSKIGLSLECQNLPRLDLLSKSDPFIVAFLKDAKSGWKEIGRTEIVVNNDCPIFVTKIILMYKFEEVQNIKFVVYDADENANVNSLSLEKQDLIGCAETVISDIVHNKKATTLPIMLNNKNRGSITIKCEEIVNNNGLIKGHITGNNVPSKCFMKLYNESEKNGYTAIYKSEVSKDGTWKPFEMNVVLFCNGDLNRPIKIEIYQFKKNGSHVLLGELITTATKLCSDVSKTVTLSNNPSITLSIQSFAYLPKPSFLQYIQNGLDLNFMVAIDFTGSNGAPSDPTSLHYANPLLYARGQLNAYEQAISSIGGVLEFYDTDKFFPVYGFGACIDNSRTSSHCFALNRNEVNPCVYGINGIMDVYHNTLTSVRFSGPTLFEQILQKAIGISMQIKPEKNKYMVLLIITDGEIHDMNETIRLIVEAADLPLSILIVGVGNSDFGKMETLDGDEVRLSYEGKVASRDIVQFVPLNQMQGQSPTDIAKQLLEEIPGQVTDYMEHNGVTVDMVAALRPYQVTPLNSN